jgi:hypothetical protein
MVVADSLAASKTATGPFSFFLFFLGCLENVVMVFFKVFFILK